MPHLELKLSPIDLVTAIGILPGVQLHMDTRAVDIILGPTRWQWQMSADRQMVLAICAAGNVPAAQHGLGADGPLHALGVAHPRRDEEGAPDHRAVGSADGEMRRPTRRRRSDEMLREVVVVVSEILDVDDILQTRRR